MGNIDVSKVVVTTQEIDPETNELVTKVTSVGKGVKHKTVGQELSRVPVPKLEKSELELRVEALEAAVAKLNKLNK